MLLCKARGARHAGSSLFRCAGWRGPARQATLGCGKLYV